MAQGRPLVALDIEENLLSVAEKLAAGSRRVYDLLLNLPEWCTP
jgi:hypothetical protein